VFNNPLADRETHASAGILHCGVKTFKDPEDLVLKLGGNADSVVLYREQPLTVAVRGRDVNLRGDTTAS